MTCTPPDSDAQRAHLIINLYSDANFHYNENNVQELTHFKRYSTHQNMIVISRSTNHIQLAKMDSELQLFTKDNQIDLAVKK